MHDDPIIFAPEFSKLIGGVPLGTIRFWDSKGTGPTSFKIGKRRAWRKSVVLQWIADQENAGGAA